MSIRKFRIMTIVMALLIWLGGVYQVRAVSPEPASLPTPTAQPPANEPGFEEEISNKLSLSAPTLPGAVLNQNAAPAGPSDPIQVLATNGHWTGTNNQGRPMSFDVLSSGNQWDNFRVEVTFSNCNVILTYTLFGPGPINNNQFSGVGIDGVFSFSGQFNSDTTASGTYNFSNIPITGCGTRSQSGTWTASISPPCEDTFEPDNNFTSAKSISVNGTAQAHNFHGPGDEDWVKFTQTAGKVYTISTSNLSAGNDTYMYLYDTNGTTILAQDDDSGPGLGSQIVQTATGNGTYYVRVRHLNNSGGCPGYNYDLAVTEDIALVEPSPLTAASISQNQIRLSWSDPNMNESGYKIERSPDGTGGWVQIATVGANVTTYLDASLTCGTTRYYRARAYNANSHSPYSNTANATTPLCPPFPPSNLTVTAASPSQINLSWQDNSNNETGFKIERSPNGVSGWQQITTVGVNVKTYANAGLACNTPYFYRVRAYNAAGNSAFSNTATASTLPCPILPPVAPTNLTATAASASQINLSWQDTGNSETGFKIERSPNSVNWNLVGQVGANVTTYQDANLPCGTTFFYRMLAHNSGGNSPYSNTANAATNTCDGSNTSLYLPLITKTPVCVPGPNQPPTFPDPLSIQTLTEFKYNGIGQLVGVVTTITVSPALDPNCDPLTYTWSATNGSIIGSDSMATWNRVVEFGRIKSGNVTVVVQDSRGGSDEVTIRFQ